MSKVKFVLVANRNRCRYEDKIVEYYNRYFPEKSNKLVVENSSLFWLAMKEGELVGVIRMITDFSRYALLLDLIVRKVERNHGIGKKLVKLAEKYSQAKNINHLILTTDSRVGWLTCFYEKIGFKVITDQSLMEYKCGLI